jgi:hypothetical protein
MAHRSHGPGGDEGAGPEDHHPECGGGWSIEAVATERRGDLTGWKASFRQAEPRRSSGAWIDGVGTGSGRANSHRGSEVHSPTGRGKPEESPSPRLSGAARLMRHGWMGSARQAMPIALPLNYNDRLAAPRRGVSPQPAGPPDADPYVRWCGRGLTGRTRRSLFGLCAEHTFSHCF